MRLRNIARFVLIAGVTPATDPARSENRLWEEPVRVSGASETESFVFQELLRGRGPEFRLHAVVNRQELRASVRSYYLAVGRELDWNEAWSKREEFTYDAAETDSRYIANVPVAVVDSRDRIHVIHEAFDAFA